MQTHSPFVYFTYRNLFKSLVLPSPFKKLPMNKLAFAVLCSLPTFAFAAPAADSAYSTDAQHSFVEDATSKGIGQVNMITCFMSSMRPDALVNQGNYVALVDQSKCDPNARSSASNSGSSNGGAQAADYMTAIVNSTRVSNSDPMIAKIWIDDVNEGQKSLIFVRTSATQAPTDSNPYGIFRLDFCGKAVAVPLGSQCMMQGFLDGSATGLSYFQHEGGGGRDNTTALRLNATSSDVGSGRLDIQQTENGSATQQIFSFAYNHDYFLRGDQCFSRDANVADFSVWRYGVYDAVSGARIERNSGFPIAYTPNGSATSYQGYLGYWGLSLPPEAMTAMALESNPIVQKVDYGQGQEPTKTNFSVVQAAGKLMKYTKQTRPLNAADKIKFNIFIGNASGFFSGATNADSNKQYEAYWDNGAGKFMVDGVINCDGSGCNSVDFDAPKQIPLAFLANQGGVQGWSQSLGGEIFIDLHGVSSIADSSAVTVVYRTQDLVYPSDMPAQLDCLRDCPTAATLASYFAPSSSDQTPFLLANNWNPTIAANLVSYTHVGAVLTDAAQAAVVFSDASALQQHPQYQSGVRSGRLFDHADAASVLCENSSTTYCDYKANDLTTYYVWETGANSWNQFAAVKDTNGSFVHFDAPLQVNYTVPAGAAYGQYAGKSIVLQYGGFGDLSGIPGYCVSHLTNAPANCNQPDSRYVPAFVIKMGEQVSNAQHTYLVKWLEREIRFAKQDMTATPAACQGLVAPGAGAITLPTAAGLNDPSNPASSIYIGDKPVLTAAPRVIQGDVKY